MTKDEKNQLRNGFDPAKHHAIIAANILLFLERLEYIDIKDDEEFEGKAFDWNEQVVHAAIEDQKECLKLAEDESGAWGLCHFVEFYNPCKHLLDNPQEISIYADNVVKLIEQGKAEMTQ